MSFLGRVSHSCKASALVSLLAASGLLAQVVQIGNDCSEYCHAVGTVAYNDAQRQGWGERRSLRAGSFAMEQCQDELSEHPMCS